MLLANIAHSASVQPAQGIQVVLQQRALAIPSDYPLDSREIKLPPRGACALLDKRQAELLCDVNDNSREGAADTVPSLALRDGEKWRDSSPSGSSYYEIQPRISADRRSVNLQVTCAKDDRRFLTVDEAVPNGSCLLIHYCTTASPREVGRLEQLLDLLFNRKPAPEYAEIFILITPRIEEGEGRNDKSEIPNKTK
jgi:hypothetical protein